MFIVLVTSGKGEEVDTVAVLLFETLEQAKVYAKRTSTYPEEKKYWTHAEVIEEGTVYEPYMYENYPHFKD